MCYLNDQDVYNMLVRLAVSLDQGGFAVLVEPVLEKDEEEARF